MKSLRNLAFVTAGFAYAVIVIGFIVRITGSGMGCGPDWPLCNGRLIPAFTSPEVAIEWLHRLAVVGLGLLTLATVALAVIERGRPGGSGPGGTLRPAGLAVVLLLVQSGLGRRAVKLELDVLTVVAHLGLAMALLAALIVLGLRAGMQGRAAAEGAAAGAGAVRSSRGAIIAAVALGALVVLLGGLTANLGAGPACQGFPLCSGQLWPKAAQSGLAHIHWTHRLLAYALFFHLLGIGIGLGKRGAPVPLQRAAWVAFGLSVAQVMVGAVMVLWALPPIWRGLHAAVGTGVWVALVYLWWVAGAGRSGLVGSE